VSWPACSGARVSGSPGAGRPGCRQGAACQGIPQFDLQHYLGSSSGEAKGVPLSNAKLVRGYFTAALASLILEDRATAAKRGEPPVLDAIRSWVIRIGMFQTSPSR